MIRRRHLAPLAAAAAAALLLAGCGGGGGGGDARRATPRCPDASLPVASGAGAGESASQAIAALGTPGAVDPAGAGQTLSGYDSFGTPHDAFDQQVERRRGLGLRARHRRRRSRPTRRSTATRSWPCRSRRDATTGGTGAGRHADPEAGAPVQNPRALEADFDVSGEPVVAREGDAIPPDTQQFLVQDDRDHEVMLELSGGLLPDGTDTVDAGGGRVDHPLQRDRQALLQDQARGRAPG